ncbi:hypothetical protein KFV08_07810 [Macrococcoides canis]|uniref:hypothetical protein n=1 Tax=Macrococcoides canis TaxID=1855823 RepID=UPI00207CED33|nr:hypothetical protein [Macrococcus canis]MCO4095722.1 hypothetical protein [Macrococcus canis]UTH08431.1 hypothetical protein KFV08_07810 [Macrococcus canis]
MELQQTKEYIKELIDSYVWKNNMLKTDKEYFQIKITAAYGVEASLPSGKGTTSDKVGNEIIRRISRQERLQQYADDIVFMNYCANQLEGIEREILEYRFDGRSLNNCGALLGIKRTRLENIHESIIEKCSKVYETKKEQKEKQHIN